MLKFKSDTLSVVLNIDLVPYHQELLNKITAVDGVKMLKEIIHRHHANRLYEEGNTISTSDLLVLFDSSYNFSENTLIITINDMLV